MEGGDLRRVEVEDTSLILAQKLARPVPQQLVQRDLSTRPSGIADVQSTNKPTA